MSLEIAMLVVALLSGSGALLFFVRYGTRLAFAERDSKEGLALARATDKEHAMTSKRVTDVEDTLHDIRNSLSKLSLIDTINANLIAMKETMTEKFATIVPRAELETRWKAHSEALGDLRDRVNDVSNS